MALHSSRLWKEEVADHSNVVRHLDREGLMKETRHRARVRPVEMCIAIQLKHERKTRLKTRSFLNAMPSTKALSSYVF